MRELILGGARSGKSALAERRALDSGLAVTYVATAESGDGEMAARVAIHRERRPAAWHTIEAPIDLAGALTRSAAAERLLLVDCLTLWLSNRLLQDAEDAEHAIRELVEVLPGLPGRQLLVSNEVGLGIVPDNALARRFRDFAGRLNQDVAAICDHVTFVAAGLPLTLK